MMKVVRVRECRITAFGEQFVGETIGGTTVIFRLKPYRVGMFRKTKRADISKIVGGGDPLWAYRQFPIYADEMEWWATLDEKGGIVESHGTMTKG